jgi:hemolysin III
MTATAPPPTPLVPHPVRELKPLLRGWLHLGTAPLALAVGLVFIAITDRSAGRWSLAIFTLTSVALFGTSALYHRRYWAEPWETRLRRIDHSNILLIIAGTYTPITVLALHGNTRTVILSVVWGGALLGIAFRVLWVHAPRLLYTPIYVLLGWTAAFVFPQLLHGAGVAATVLIIVGGGLYTIGGILYAVKWPNPWPRVLGFHELFHFFTVAAFSVHCVAIGLIALR